MIWALAGFSLVSSPFPLTASLDGAAPPSDRVDALMASIALYPDPLLAKLLIAATYPLEVDEAELWLRQHKSMAGAALDHAISSQPWDGSIKDMARVPAVLSMMDERLKWTQNLGDIFLAQPEDVFASVQRLRRLALDARTLHSNSQQNISEERARIVIEPVIAQLIEVPFYDPRVAYGQWPHPMYPPMWWTAPRGYIYGSGIGFMKGVRIPAGFWKNVMDWDTGKVRVNNVVGLSNHNPVVTTGSPWVHDPVHRRFVSYSTPQLRARYGRGFTPITETRRDFRGYDDKLAPLAEKGTMRTRGRSVQMPEGSNPKSGPQTSAFEGIDQGARVRLFSRRGHASIFAARRDNSHFAIGEAAAPAVETDTVAAR